MTSPKKPKTKPAWTKARKKTLAEFVLDKKRAACPVCALSVVARGQLRDATAKHTPVADQLEWLEAEYGVKIKRDVLQAHRNARHEQ